MEVLKIIKQQFAARFREDDLEIINEALPEIFPDKDLETISGREIVRGAVEKAVMTIRKSNQSKPEDLTKIKELTELNSDLSKSNAEIKGELSIKIEENENLSGEIALKAEIIENLEDKIKLLSANIIESSENLKTLQKFKPLENEMRGIVPPLTLKLLLLYARKVSAIKKQEIRAFDILISLFNRYITKKEVELPGFPFVISDTEIRKAKAEIDGQKPTE